MKGNFWKPFLALFLVGLLGVVSLLFMIIPQIAATIVVMPELAELPDFLIAALSLIQPMVLLAISVAVGCFLAPRLGLRSYIAEKAQSGTAILPRLRPQLPLAVASGLILAVFISLLDMVFITTITQELQEMQSSQIHPAAQLIVGMFYGGITEELLLRWGFMTLLVWLGWRIIQHAEGIPSIPVAWGAIILAAILFGIGHLPAMAAMLPLTAGIIARTVLLNAVGGVLFGWLFWRHSLEAAMVAHASTHLGFALLGLLFSAYISV
jgi:hypothetical protein